MTKPETGTDTFVSSAIRGRSAFRGETAFTILELLIVISIIIILAGLTIATMSYVQSKARRSRAEAEIAAISAALENYKADNGIYPSDAATNALDPSSDVNPSSTPHPNKYDTAGTSLYQQLGGDQDKDPATPADDTKNYISPLVKPDNVASNPAGGSYLKDPFGNAFGYSTSKSNGGNGYNPTFDLWSTADGKTQPETVGWIKNW
jgi:type II secretory pathway pseudopilin PulG